MSRFAFRNVEVDDRLVDVTVAAARIVAVEAPGTATAAESIDGRRGALIPGLHDHHIHLMAMAAARTSVDVSPAAVRDAAGFAAALRAVGPGGRAVGYHESVAGSLDRWALDRLVGDRPVRVQHRTGALWILSSAALEELPARVLDRSGVRRDERGQPTGEVFGLDTELRVRGGAPPDLATIGRDLARYGVTAVTDMTPVEDAGDLALLAAGVLRPDFPVRVAVSGGPGLAPDAGPGLERGPVKVIVADHALPSLDDLAGAFRSARRQGRAVAVHCVTRVALVLALAAWHDVGSVPGDRIEHGAVIPLELVDDIRRLGLTVVTQPSFVRERGDDYRRDVDPADQPDLWRCRTLVDGGVRVGGSTDAPYGSPDPWLAVRAAVDRTTASGVVLGAGERLGPPAAIALFLAGDAEPGGPPRRVVAGAAAELCLLHVPLDAMRRDPSSELVRGTYGRAGWCYSAGR